MVSMPKTAHRLNMTISLSEQQKTLPNPKYRSDIDGLRAIAVLVVVGYHAFPDWVQGGFIGVDIFFVISGFLISTIVFGYLDRNIFSFVDFYRRRIKRIFPALLVVLSACMLVGWFFLTSGEYKVLGKHVMGGAGFISNIIFWRESGYFDSSADTKILLHLWSLGVEEQYYIIWPVLLWAAWKSKVNLFAVTITLLVFTFLFNIIVVQTDVTTAYFSPLTRFWEILIGSALAYIKLHPSEAQTRVKRSILPFLKLNETTLRNAQSVAGGGLILLGLILIDEGTRFPSWWALLPTLGAMLLIAAGTDAWINRTILSKPIFVWFGLISYPLYLWHWPLLAFANILSIEALSSGYRIALVALSVILAWLTYTLAEQPVKMGVGGTAIAPALIMGMVLVGMGGSFIYVNQGMQGVGYRDTSDFELYFENTPPDWNYFKKIDLTNAYRFDCSFYDTTKHMNLSPTNVPLKVSQINPSCYTRDFQKNHAVLIWGDSHAQQLHYGLAQNLSKDWQVLITASSGCKADPFIKEDSDTDFCQRSNWFAIKTIKKVKPDVVIVAQESVITVDEINALSALLLKSGRTKLIIMGPTPQWNDNLPTIILRELWGDIPERTFTGINKDVLNKNDELRVNFPPYDNLIFVNLIGFFCNEAGCLTRVGNDIRTDITTWDTGHLTPSASDYLAKYLLADIVEGRENP